MTTWDTIVSELADREDITAVSDVRQCVDDDDDPKGLLAAWIERQRGMETDTQILSDLLDYVLPKNATGIVDSLISSGTCPAMWAWANLHDAATDLASREIWSSIDAYRLVQGVQDALDSSDRAARREHGDLVQDDQRALAREWQP
jgi:hypothetical protein